MERQSLVPITIRDSFWRDPFFSSSWKEFDCLQGQMMRNSSFMFDRFCRNIPFQHGSIENAFHTNSFCDDSSLFSLHPYFNSHMWPSNRSWFTHGFMRNEDMFKRPQELTGQDEHLISLKNNEDKFEISLNTHPYKPEEIQVNIKDRVLSISARQEEKNENESKFVVAREFTKTYSLPQNVKIETLHSNLSADGVLVISAEKTKPTPGECEERNIPIACESQDSLPSQ